jgi:hypothetical protein
LKNLYISSFSSDILAERILQFLGFYASILFSASLNMQFLPSLLLTASTFTTLIAALPQATPVVTAPAFTLEGYGKTNPTAAVSGGAGGATTTVSASAALQSAVKVYSLHHTQILIRGGID